MQYKTHIMTSLAISLPVMHITGTLTTPAVVGLCLGTLLPDIDEPKSWIGRRSRGVSDGTKLIFGHRGITHSIIAVLTAAVISLLLSVIIGFGAEIAVWFALGYLFHLLEDSFSKSGIAWLRPFSNKCYQSGAGIVYYTTGSLVEKLIFLAVGSLVVWETYILGSNTFLPALQEKIRNLFIR